jgi:hypothetical protein
MAPKAPVVVSLSCEVHVAPPFVVWIIAEGEIGLDERESTTAQPLLASANEMERITLFALVVYCGDQFVPPSVL